MTLGRFSKITFLILACTSFISIRATAQEIGLELYSLRNQFAKDVPGTMAKVKDMGIKEIEIGGTYGLAFPDFMKLLAQNDLNVVSYGTDFERLEKFPQTVVDEARAFGARYVVCFWIPHKEDSFNVVDVERAATVFNNAGRLMAQSGLLLCYHPHGFEFKPYQNGTLFDYMVDKFDSRFVHFQMDVFWVKQPGQDPVALLRKYPTRFVMLHLKDRKPGTPNSDNGHADVESNVVLGTGDVGIAEIMKEAKKNGIKHFFIEDESSRSEEQIPLSIAFLKALP